MYEKEYSGAIKGGSFQEQINPTNISTTNIGQNNLDPWIHRSDGMRCKTCIWFVPKQPSAKLGYDLGRCRRHAPTMNGYPVVFVNDWCGDHRVDENKV
jgi:hypothetical protein